MPTISFDVTAQQGQRLQTAVGKVRNLGRDATAPEVRAWLIECAKNLVQGSERIEVEKAIVPSPFDVA